MKYVTCDVQCEYTELIYTGQIKYFALNLSEGLKSLKTMCDDDVYVS